MLDITIKYQKAFVRLENEDPQFEAFFSERINGTKKCGPPRERIGKRLQGW